MYGLSTERILTMMLFIWLILLTTIPSQAWACPSDNMELAAKGKRLFNGKAVCWGCHGVNADPSTVTDKQVAQLNPPPTDLRKGSSLRLHTDDARYDAIRNGIKGTGMPAFRGSLYDQEIQLIIEYLEVLKNGDC